MKKGKLNHNTIITMVSMIRENNNRAWMSILRLAFKHAPRKAKALMKQITENDRKISAWMDRL